MQIELRCANCKQELEVSDTEHDFATNGVILIVKPHKNIDCYDCKDCEEVPSLKKQITELQEALKTVRQTIVEEIKKGIDNILKP